MDSYQIVNLFIQLLGLAVFGERSWRWLRARRRPVGTLVGVVMTTCFFWFGLGLFINIARFVGGVSTNPYLIAQLMLVFLFPPMIMHLMFEEQRQQQPAALDSPWWRPLYRLQYLFATAIGLFVLLSLHDRIEWVAKRTLGQLIALLIGAGFLVAAVFSIAVLRRTRREKPRSARRERGRGDLLLYIVLAAFSLLMIFGSPFGKLLETIGASMPLMFALIGTWEENRFEFVDQLVKRLAYLILIIFSLLAYFRWVWPTLMRLDVGEQRAWLQALAILPLFVLLNFLYRGASHWIERAWFGRRFSTVEAVREFLGAVGTATTEDELATAAEAGLGRIFSADVEVQLQPLETDSARHEQHIPIRYDGDSRGQILLGARHNHLPYFVSDTELLNSLADVLAAILENVRLQHRKQELSLSASRSELKALRAQINPHFLFNALNSIAGLIHQQPQKADRTIEQLAEVFRYTLRGSTSEWAKLCDEVEFAEAYLDVEQARFGARLEVELDIDDSTLGAYIPTMMLQTLVENAIKHGVAQRRGVAQVAIRARRQSERLKLHVEDSGPTTDLRPVGDASGDQPFGLSYIERRLTAHFGAEASFKLSRDPSRERTVAALDLPFREEKV